MSMRWLPPLLRAAPAAVLALIVLGACAPAHYRMAGGPSPAARSAPGGRIAPGYVKDKQPSIWISSHPRVVRFYEHYSRTSTVRTALENGRRYLPTITRIFRQRRLPLELAYLPMLESMFENRANSGRARGLWQFTAGTAGHMGLAVGAFADERVNWHKATVAAAEYLEQLGEKFDYDWALALAAYNGGPGYLERAMRDQRRGDFFSLRLRRETAEYVPRFVAMVQVAKEKYAHLLMAGR